MGRSCNRFTQPGEVATWLGCALCKTEMKRRGHSGQLSHSEGGSRDRRTGCGEWLHWILDHRGNVAFCVLREEDAAGPIRDTDEVCDGIVELNQCWCVWMNFDFSSRSSLENTNWRAGEREFSWKSTCLPNRRSQDLSPEHKPCMLESTCQPRSEDRETGRSLGLASRRGTLGKAGIRKDPVSKSSV